ncbi:MAG: diguanylate cyclase [Magnetococcales bacterium]|nr:diguanylate cyclase [Magnetococcales bacterium]MBF0321642.1 diguanylate cyclase [Magnetococcales bacterium]
MSEKPVILVVDDESFNIDVLLNLLGQEYTITIAKNGEQALKRLTGKTMPDLVLLDIMMPGMDGYEVCRCIKEGFRTRHVPVIFITALSDVSEETAGFQAGAVDYITKPFCPAVVTARVRTHIELKRSRDLLEILAKEDGLTGIANRRRFNEFLEFEWSRAQRKQTSISLTLMDVDFFKLFNDHYGHAVGDACLRQVGHALRRSMHRTVDLVARYGGEEFCCVLPDTESPGAMGVANRLLCAVHELAIPHHHSKVADHVTMSLGVASLVPAAGQGSEILIHMADQALYKAKNGGRNRVELARTEDAAD